MIPEPLRRTSRRALTVIEPLERRGWLTHGIAALTVSALGLAVAGSVAVSTSAETNGAHVVAAQAPASQAQPYQPQSQTAQPAQPQTKAAASKGTLSAFDRREAAADQTSRSEDRALQAKERSAYRSESLSRDAEAAIRKAHEETLRQRAKDLNKAEKESYENAVRVAKQRSDAAARRLQEQRNSGDPTNSENTESSDSESFDSGNDEPVGDSGGSASPVPGAVVGAHFGQTGLWSRYHTGLDFRAGAGTPIKAVKSGIVLYAGNSGNWAGNHIAIKHGDGKTTMSSHMSRMSVSAGQRVQAGQVIGYVGSTGRAFGAHLHFELYPNGVKYGDVYSAINPQPWLSANGVQTR